MEVMVKKIVEMITTIVGGSLFMMHHYENSGAFFYRYLIKYDAM